MLIWYGIFFEGMRAQRQTRYLDFLSGLMWSPGYKITTMLETLRHLVPHVANHMLSRFLYLGQLAPPASPPASPAWLGRELQTVPLFV